VQIVYVILLDTIILLISLIITSETLSKTGDIYPRFQFAAVGNEATITCISYDNPFWSKKDKALNIFRQGRKTHFVIANATHEDEGTYNCHGRHSNGSSFARKSAINVVGITLLYNCNSLSFLKSVL